MKTNTYCGWMALLLVAVPLLLACPTWAQESETFKAEDLDQMLAPIALYPDPLLAQVLMACTYPAEVAEAAQWSQSNAKQKGDAAVTAVQGKPWDPSVKSLVAFPQALATMDQEPEWVQKVGDAFLAQPNDVMDSVQRLRAAAQQFWPRPPREAWCGSSIPPRRPTCMSSVLRGPCSWRPPPIGQALPIYYLHPARGMATLAAAVPLTRETQPSTCARNRPDGTRAWPCANPRCQGPVHG